MERFLFLFIKISQANSLTFYFKIKSNTKCCENMARIKIQQSKTGRSPRRNLSLFAVKKHVPNWNTMCTTAENTKKVSDIKYFR
jgi:hypothetical protein